MCQSLRSRCELFLRLHFAVFSLCLFGFYCLGIELRCALQRVATPNLLYRFETARQRARMPVLNSVTDYEASDAEDCR